MGALKGRFWLFEALLADFSRFPCYLPTRSFPEAEGLSLQRLQDRALEGRQDKPSILNPEAGKRADLNSNPLSPKRVPEIRHP